MKQYADTACKFFEDPLLDTLVVDEKEITEALGELKPQPLPEARKRIVLDTWKWLGYKEGQDDHDRDRIHHWNNKEGFRVENESLLAVDQGASFSLQVDSQPWRFFLAWCMKPGSAHAQTSLTLEGLDDCGTALTVGFADNNRLFYRSQGKTCFGPSYEEDQWYQFKVEVDVKQEYRRYNLFVNGEQLANFIPFEETQVSCIEKLTLTCNRGDVLKYIWGVGYKPLYEDSHFPFSIETFIDENFIVKPDIDGWNERNYCDSNWEIAELPHVHGGERYGGEDLYLRKTITIGTFDAAILNIETLDPSGEIWINGQPVKRVDTREPQKLDISQYLEPNAENLIAICVDHFEVTEEERSQHAPTDPHIGWFAGRMTLDLRDPSYIDDLFIFTEDIAEPAVLRARIELANERDKLFEGKVRLKMFSWFPEESNTPKAKTEVQVYLEPNGRQMVEALLSVEQPQLWTYKDPHLYKVRAILEDENGRAIDDYVVTTGIRTVSQEGGMFRINGEPELLRAPLFFGFRPPLEKTALRHRCGPEDWLMRELLMVRKMNANGGRMSVHHGRVLSINDPRFAEMADQVGFMWIWATTPWVRQDSVWESDWSGLGKYVRQVYNHPSIIMWQTSNHPDFQGDFSEAMKFFRLIYNSIYSLDPSRLISPVADYRRIGPPADDGKTDLDGNETDTPAIWTAPMLTRGSMDTPTGYGRDWEVLRSWPYPKEWKGGVFQPDFLASKERAYFNFEHEESIGQPNWNLRRGKPHYRLHSYEWYYDKSGEDDQNRRGNGSIGRKLTADEWRQSQAWQAFSAYEAIRKMRILGYDGLCWCCLHGGANCATYQKPPIDFYGHAKLAFYANRMGFQDVLAGSGNVDMVYGPEDTVSPVVLNLGQARDVDVEIAVCTVEGEVISTKTHRGIHLPAGREAVNLPEFDFSCQQEGYYVIRYVVHEQNV